jgi:zinc/manganese transport system permease protein
MELCFLIVMALATSMTVPVVGALLVFALTIGPAAAARSFTRRPEQAIALAAGIALVTAWAGIAASYRTNWPLGFFAGVIAAGFFLLGQGWGTVRRRGPARALSPVPLSRTAAWRLTVPSPIPERAVAYQQSPPPVRDKGVSS